jgi:hypothetical protein
VLRLAPNSLSQEALFTVIKQRFGFHKIRLRGLAKNRCNPRLGSTVESVLSPTAVALSSLDRDLTWLNGFTQVQNQP